MRIFTPNLNKVRHFYYSYLNCLCLSWNLRDLLGTRLSCSGVSPLGAFGLLPSPPPMRLSVLQLGEVCAVLKQDQDAQANLNNGENPNPDFLSEQMIQISVSLEQHALLFTVRADYC